MPMLWQTASSSSHLAYPTSNGALQSAPTSPQPTAPYATPQNTPQGTVPPNIPENTPVITSQNPKQTNLQQTSSNDQEPANRNLQQAVGNATIYFAQNQEPYALLLLDVLYRRFGVTEFADSLQRYDRILAENPENAPLLRIFRRIANYNNTLQPEDFYAVTADVDKITVPALYSDRGSLPDNYVSELNDAAHSGGYMLTHALLAIIWLQDNHCDPGYDFRESVYHANAELISDDPVVTDLELEAATFLYAAGQGTLVDSTFVQLVMAAQNYDGGWSYSNDKPDSSNWHTSVLGLMLLLHIEFPAASYPPMLVSAPSYESTLLNQPILCFVAVWLFASAKLKKKPLQFSLGQPN